MVQWGEAVRMSEKTRTWRGKQFNDSDGAVKTRRGLSALLALLLLVLLSTSAFPVMADSANVAMITGTNISYTSLQDAFDAAASVTVGSGSSAVTTNYASLHEALSAAAIAGETDITITLLKNISGEAREQKEQIIL